MSKARRIADVYFNEKRDAKERTECLALQARAWRIIAIIATAEPERGAKMAQWLLFHSVPFVDGEAVKKLIAENEQDAERCGKQSGVFTNAA